MQNLVTQNIKPRESWLDYCKGIGIILVVFAHCITRLGQMGGVIEFIWISIYTMHMPLFFVLAGCVLSDRKTIGKFVVGKFKRLVGAYVLFAFLTTSVDIAIDFCLKRNNTMIELKNGIINILLMSTESRYCYLWFFPVMFWGTIIAFLIVKIIRVDSIRILVSLILLISNQLLCRFNIPSVYGLRESLYAQFFIVAGYFLKQKKDLIKKQSNIVICLVFTLIWLYGSYEWMISGKPSIMSTTNN